MNIANKMYVIVTVFLFFDFMIEASLVWGKKAILIMTH